jgi:hypothetical protein
MLSILKSTYRAMVPSGARAVIGSIYRDWRVSALKRRIQQTGVTSIIYNGQHVPLFFHPFNCGDAKVRTTERSVELALAFRWLRLLSGPAIEVGAVTPYYLDANSELTKKIKRVIDPVDPHLRVTDRCSLFDYNFSGRNVISISTLEHVGTGDYGLSDEDCVHACEKLVRDTASCFITVPLGYNQKLDFHLHSAHWPRTTLTLVYRSPSLNDWKVTSDRDFIGKILYGPAWANGIAIIERLIHE